MFRVLNKPSSGWWWCVWRTCVGSVCTVCSKMAGWVEVTARVCDLRSSSGKSWSETLPPFVCRLASSFRFWSAASCRVFKSRVSCSGSWRRVFRYLGTDVSDIVTTSVFTAPCTLTQNTADFLSGVVHIRRETEFYTHIKQGSSLHTKLSSPRDMWSAIYLPKVSFRVWRHCPCNFVQSLLCLLTWRHLGIYILYKPVLFLYQAWAGNVARMDERCDDRGLSEVRNVEID